MKSALILAEGRYQVVLEGETDQEKSIIKVMSELQFSAHLTDFTVDICKGGYLKTFENPATRYNRYLSQLVLVSEEPREKVGEEVL